MSKAMFAQLLMSAEPLPVRMDKIRYLTVDEARNFLHYSDIDLPFVFYSNALLNGCVPVKNVIYRVFDHGYEISF